MSIGSGHQVLPQNSELNGRLYPEPIIHGLPELLLAMSIFITAVAGLVTVQILGLKMNALTAGKLQSTTAGLRVLNHIHDRVLEANSAVAFRPWVSTTPMRTSSPRLARRMASLNIE